MLYEIDPSITTPEDVRKDPELAANADKVYKESHNGLRTIVPSSVCYLPFSHFVPQKELQKYSSQLLSESTKISLPKDKILVDRLTTDQNLGQIEFYFDVNNFCPYYASQPGKKYATMLMMLQYPFSVGNIHIPPTKTEKGTIATSDDYPVIDPKYYENTGGKIDYELMKTCQSFADKICSTAPLSDMLVKRVYPDVADGNKPEDFAQWVTDSTITDWHPVGTCAMGGSEPAKAIQEGFVCDERLRVYGTKGLRVCDASIMPLQIAAHLQATVYAIGEKGAEMMKEDWAGGKTATNGHTTTNGYTNGHA